jgi:DNA-directed RNA polymerase specialized sigma24 family protein
MQKDAAGWISKVGKAEKSDVEQEFGFGLFEEIQPLAADHGVGSKALASALKEAVFEISQNQSDNKLSVDARRSRLLGLILWKLFSAGEALWINPTTASENPVPPDLTVTAYRLWKRAASFAEKYHVDEASAAETLAQATHAVADQLARNAHGAEEKIHSLYDYLFATFMNLIFRIAAKQELSRTESIEVRSLVNESDDGAFTKALESSIFCRELLDTMPRKGKNVAIARYIMGYGWQETAEALDTSINAAQKAQSVGLKKAFGTFLQEIQKVRRLKTGIGSRLARKKRTPIF